MTRSLVAALALALTVPSAALACSEHVKAKLDAIAQGQTAEQAEATAAKKMAAKAKAQSKAKAKAATPEQAAAPATK
jgi:hypothetical protein